MTPLSVWRQVVRGLRVLFDRKAADRDARDEVDHIFEQAVAEHRARGLGPAEAERATRLELGSPTAMRESARDYGWENVIDGLATDLRYAVRRLRAAPGFTAITILTLAVGIGTTTAIFSAVKPILVESLPYPAPRRLTMIWEAAKDGTRLDGTYGSYRSILERTTGFADVAVVKTWLPTLTGFDQPERLEGQAVSAGYFRTLGVAMALGSGLDARDDHPGGTRVAILSDGLWRRRFGGDRAIVGRAINLNGDPYLVAGVLPPSFENVLAPGAQIWTLLQYDLTDPRAWGHHLRTIGRLRDGVAPEQVRGELARLGPDLERMAAASRGFFPGGFAVTVLKDDVTRGVKDALLAIVGAVVLVLLIACVNVTNLLIARGVNRSGELAVRATLGAGRGRLIRQLLTESILLAALGGAAGMVIAIVGVKALVAMSPPNLPRVGSITVDGMVFAFGLGLSTLVGVAFGIIPALEAAGRDPQEGLQWTSRRTVGGHRRTRSLLVVAEVALALILLVSSGLLLRSLEQLLSVQSGFDPSRLLTMQIQTSGHRFDSDSVTRRYFEDVLAVARRVPGVASAGLTSQMPLSGDRDEYGAHFEPGPGEEPRSYSVYRYAVSPGYLETMRIPLRQGRLLDDRDRSGGPPAALISESLAKRRFGTRDPIGARFRIGPPTSPLYQIVGVVGDVHQASLGVVEADAVYTTSAQALWADGAMSLVVRTSAEPAGLAPAVRQAIWSVDKDQPIVRLGTMEDLVARTAAERRFSLILFEAFAVAALVLAAAGIYGVMSAIVAERTREIGLRSALGATRGNTISMVVRQGMGLAAVGALVGLVGALLATRAIVAMLFGVTLLDPITYGGVTILLATVALIASSVPAWRAARVDPVTTLRVE